MAAHSWAVAAVTGLMLILGLPVRADDVHADAGAGAVTVPFLPPPPAALPPPSSRRAVKPTLHACMPATAPSPAVRILLNQTALITNWREYRLERDLQGWDAATPLCNWTDIDCSELGIFMNVGLSCADNCTVRAQGTLLPDLRLLNVTNIFMSGQSLSGSLPHEWSLPGSFPSLRFLQLQSNRLTGTLPETWGSADVLPRLKDLQLEDNRLSGTLPSAWGSPSRFAINEIEGIRLNNNTFTGSLPASWASGFGGTYYMFLNNNSFVGTIPDEWGTKEAFALNGTGRTLEQLRLYDTGVCGPVPAVLVRPMCYPNGSPDWYLPYCGDIVMDGAIPCPSPPPAPPPRPPAPAPPPPPPAPPVSVSSSAPVGAIVGGIAGGAAVLAVLAFLAFRPRRGWLRRPVAHTGSGVLPKSQPLFNDGSSIAGKDVGLPGGSPSTLPLDSNSQGSLGSDPVLAYIRAELESRRRRGAPVDSCAGVDTFITAGKDSLSTVGTPPQPSDMHMQVLLAGQIGAAPPSSVPAGSVLPADMQLWAVEWSTIVLERPIGKGSFGWVYLARWQDTPVAAKVLINTDDLSEGGLELPSTTLAALEEEAGLMARMRHPNVVSLLGMCALPPCILTEYCSRGSLFDVLRGGTRDAHRATELTWRRRLHLVLGAARGLHYLHTRSPPIIHRDVKTPNILVDEAWHAKLSDFNLSRLLLEQTGSAASTGGAHNPLWLAPEVLAGKRETAASDIYALGVVMWEVLTWALPWAGVHYFSIPALVMAGERPAVSPRGALPGPDTAAFDGLDEYIALMSACWAQSPADRPALEDVVRRLRELLECAEGSTVLNVTEHGVEGGTGVGAALG